ncbi:MAG: DNA mismatch repair endonuclease MutL [Candidatus Lernaella stagnicola]|nr:DNA mismatch repair endonuclease MutL [Candidatus Lernaella stagnicola]
MSSRIHVMTDQLANQIAAGEVVEKPASVVKELVENALDAGATRVIVEVEDGGRQLIRVTDNGHGMTAEDAALSLRRHATSKIRTEADLWRIATLGFRGEALPAIASVSRLTLETKETDAMVGATIEAEGGEIRATGEAGIPAGTVLAVRDLFFNTPARRKFLRSSKTELSHVAEAITRLALWRPGVYFEFSEAGKTIMQVPATESLPERISALLGRQVLSHLFEFTESFPFFEMHGYATNPDFHRGSTKHIFPYINQRHVRDRVLIAAVTGAYAGHLIKGRYPAAVFNIEIDPSLVDVNVHPAKAEVRFRQPAGVFENLRRTLKNALAARFVQPADRGFLSQYGRSAESVPSGTPEHAATDSAPSAGGDLFRIPGHQGDLHAPALPQHTPTRLDIEVNADAPEPEIGRFSGLHIIGQFVDSYIVCENRAGAGSLLLIDQHAAHERINYERLRQGMLGGAVEVQNLLIPLTLELRSVEEKALQVVLEDLGRIGVVVEPFGPGSWRLEAAPAILHEGQARDVVLDAIEHVRQTGTGGNAAERIEAILITASCHGSVRAGQALTVPQMREILRGLDGCEQPTTCPHGRPTIREYPLDDIERAFARR